MGNFGWTRLKQTRSTTRKAKEGEFKLLIGHLFGHCRKQSKTLVGGTVSVLSNS